MTPGSYEKDMKEMAQSVKQSCATCGKELDIKDMKTCMDSRQMHRYVCDSKCMTDFYA